MVAHLPLSSVLRGSEWHSQARPLRSPDSLDSGISGAIVQCVQWATAILVWLTRMGTSVWVLTWLASLKAELKWAGSRAREPACCEPLLAKGWVSGRKKTSNSGLIAPRESLCSTNCTGEGKLREERKKCRSFAFLM